MNKKRKDIERRILEEARFFIDNNSTVRKTANAFGLSKSTIYLDLAKKLPNYSHPLSVKVYAILNKNKEERALRGGNATAAKYRSKKS